MHVCESKVWQFKMDLFVYSKYHVFILCAWHLYVSYGHAN